VQGKAEEERNRGDQEGCGVSAAVSGQDKNQDVGGAGIASHALRTLRGVGSHDDCPDTIESMGHGGQQFLAF